jgi:hypothetical protein
MSYSETKFKIKDYEESVYIKDSIKILGDSLVANLNDLKSKCSPCIIIIDFNAGLFPICGILCESLEVLLD